MEQKRLMEIETAPRLSLYIAALNGDWDTIRASLRDGSIALSDKISMFSENLIHVIVGRGHCMAFLIELLNDQNFDPQMLLQTDYQGNTALFLAATAGYTEAARILVEKNPDLLTFRTGEFPVYAAARFGHKETVGYLIDETKKRPDHDFHGQMGVLLLNLLITAGFFGMALSLLDDFPESAHGREPQRTTPLETLVNGSLVFRYGSDARQHDEKETALELVRRICKDVCKYALRPEVNTNASGFLWEPLRKAAKLGIHEIVIEILNTCPYMIWFSDSDEHERTIIHYAVLYRHEKIFNLIWNLGLNKYRIAELRGTSSFSDILHLAAKLGPTSQVSGAALQMQRELHWFNEVEKLFQLSFQEKLNEDKKTPREVFTEEHKDLVKEGERWMKTTASASTVVAALIVTVVFAAAFTLPGGNDSKGIAIFLQKPSFTVFSISNAIAVYSSATSLIMFLSILTSRYSEMDFLHSLPQKLVIGLCTLFLSILCMLIAFGATLHLCLLHQSKFVLIPIILATCIPAILFVMLQFPLLYQIAYSTYGPSIFRQEVNIDYTNNTSATNQTPTPAPARPTGTSSV